MELAKSVIIGKYLVYFQHIFGCLFRIDSRFKLLYYVSEIEARIKQTDIYFY